MESFYIDLEFNLEFSPNGKIPILVRRWGHGPRVLLVHGWLDSSLRWTDLGERLGRHYEVWALDLPSFGQTPAIWLDYTTLEIYAAILAEFILEITNEQELHGLLGHSMGAQLSLLLLKRMLPAKRVIVCGAPVTDVKWLQPVANQPKLVANCLSAFKTLPIGIQIPVVKLGKLIALRSWTAAKNEQQTLADVNVRAAAILLKQVCACDLLDELEPCSAEVLVIHGQHDPYVSRPVSERLAEKLSGLFYEFQGSHHAPMVEKPERFYHVVKDFLDGFREF